MQPPIYLQCFVLKASDVAVDYGCCCKFVCRCICLKNCY